MPFNAFTFLIAAANWGSNKSGLRVLTTLSIMLSLKEFNFPVFINLTSPAKVPEPLTNPSKFFKALSNLV